jgi:hypothetical protein
MSYLLASPMLTPVMDGATSEFKIVVAISADKVSETVAPAAKKHYSLPR